LGSLNRLSIRREIPLHRAGRWDFETTSICFIGRFEGMVEKNMAGSEQFKAQVPYFTEDLDF
jgi:hypothetical protein